MKEFDRLLKVIEKLHSPSGCPWDKAQTADDYKRYLLEEAYELVDGMQHKNTKVIKEELGDLFLILATITYHFNKNKKFTITDVLKTINEKLISRHPHVFSSRKLATKEEVLSHWIKNKAKRKKRKTIKERLPLSSPSLLMAELFLKECGYLGKKTRRSQEQIISQRLVSLAKEMESAKESKTKEKLTSDIIFELCKLSYINKIELETLFRHRVLQEAEKVSY